MLGLLSSLAPAAQDCRYCTHNAASSCLKGPAVGEHNSLSTDTQASHVCLNLSGLGVLPSFSPIVQHYGPGQTSGGLHVLPLLREGDLRKWPSPGLRNAQSTEKCPKRPHRLRIPPPPLVSHRMLISSAINLLKHILTISRTPSTCTQARHLPSYYIEVQALLSPAALTSQRNGCYGWLRYRPLLLILNFRLMPAFGSV